MSTLTITANPRRKQGTPLGYFLAFVAALFIGILIFAYVITKRTNPVFLDEHGKPAASSSGHSHAGH